MIAKCKITGSLKPPLTKRPSEVGYCQLSEMPGSSECLRQKHQFLNFWSKTIWGNYGKWVKPKWERRVSNRWNHIRKSGITVNGWESPALNLETWTLNKSNLDFDKQLFYCAYLRKMFEVNYFRGKYDKRSASPLMLSIVFCILLWGS